jgi:hypothetical protein
MVKELLVVGPAVGLQKESSMPCCHQGDTSKAGGSRVAHCRIVQLQTLSTVCYRRAGGRVAGRNRGG